MTVSPSLTAAQLDELRSELVSARARFERSADEAPAAANGPSASGTTPATMQGRLAVALETRSQIRYDAVVDALRRIDDGTYGICTDCKGEIPYGRLIVMPEVARCVACGPRD